MPFAFPNRLLSDQPVLQDVLLRLVTDPDPQVRMQLAYSLGASGMIRGPGGPWRTSRLGTRMTR